MFHCLLGFFSGQSGYEATSSRRELGVLLATAQMLHTSVHLSLGGQTVLLSILDSAESGGVMRCLTGNGHFWGSTEILCECVCVYVCVFLSCFLSLRRR